jgi:RNA polymerase sigma factor (TIGR02999 family)
MNHDSDRPCKPENDLLPADAQVLLPLVYQELRKLAAQKLAQEKPGQTLDATALVHEAYLRLTGKEKPPKWENQGHFFAAAAEAMRRILVESARRRQSLKRGGNREREEIADQNFFLPHQPQEVLDIHDALESLAADYPQAAELVKLRYFVGLTNAEAAQVLGISERTVANHWEYARAWLKVHLGESDSGVR